MLLLRKDRCKDMFFKDEFMKSINYDRKEKIRELVQENFKTKILEHNINKIDMMLKLKAFRGVHYLNALIVKQQLIKDRFIIMLQNESVVVIPKEINQLDLPLSFRYYDFILMFIQENLSNNRKLFLKLKSKIQHIFEKHKSLKAHIGIQQLEDSYKSKLDNKLKYVLDFKVQL